VFKTPLRRVGGFFDLDEPQSGRDFTGGNGQFLDRARGEIFGQIRHLIGEDGARAVETVLENARQPAHSIPAAVLGFLMLLFGASGVFGQMQEALNTVWHVQPKEGRGFWGILKDRFLSFTMVVGIGFLLMVSLILSAALHGFGRFLNAQWPGSAPLIQSLNVLMSYGVFTLLFAMMYKILPDVRLRWRDVWLGSAITAALFTLGKYLIGLYLGNSTIGTTYGAAGSLVIVLMWVYYSSQVMLLGAEFTKVFAKKFEHRKPKPAPNAEPVPKPAS
jgi:membrane protein